MIMDEYSVGDLIKLNGQGWIDYCNGHYYNKLYLVHTVEMLQMPREMYVMHGYFLDENGDLEGFNDSLYNTEIVSKVR